MTDDSYLIYQLANQDPRYPVEAYWFVREALAYASDSIELCSDEFEPDMDLDTANHRVQRERHLTGQQLCESIRQYALNQFGYMAQVVLKNWNISKTDCFGDIVYNMISAGLMKKSSEDKKSHFDGVYEFDEVFVREFAICDVMAQRRS